MYSTMIIPHFRRLPRQHAAAVGLHQEDVNGENVNVSHNPDVRDGEPYLLRCFPTKSSPFIALHFTRRNLLLAVGMFDGSNNSSNQ